MERKRPSSFKSPGKQHSLNKNLKGTSRRTKSCNGKTYKRIFSCEETSSDELVNADESRIQNAQIYSRATGGEKSRKEAAREIERKRPSTKSPYKQQSSKKNGEETSQRTKSSKRKTYKRINYCEDSSPDESMNDNLSRIHLYSCATGEDNRRKEATSSLTTLSIKNKTGEGYNKIPISKDSSSDDLYIDVVEMDTKNNIPDADKFLNESSSSAMLPDRPDLSEFGNCSPFMFWGKNAEAIRHSKGDEEHKKFGIEVEDGPCARKVPKLVNKDDVDKAWEKYKARKIQKDKKKPSKTEIDDAEPGGSSSHYEREDALKSVKPIFPSEGDMVHKKDGIEVENDACVRNASKISNDNLKKESEQYKALNKQLDNRKELSRSKSDDAEPGSSSSFQCRWKYAFKSIKPIFHSEGDMEHKNDCTEVEDVACVRNAPKLVNNENVKKAGEKCKSLKTLEKKELRRSKLEDVVNADKNVPTYEGSNENIPDLKISPVTAKNKGVQKRLSYPSNALKENRPRPSI